MINRIGIGKQNHFKSVPYLVAWVDLLGYGSMLRDAGYDPTSKKAESAVKRIEQFNLISLKYAHRVFPLLQLNDGIAAWRELSFRTKSVTQDFISRAIEFFNEITQNELALGYPGPRMVIAAGIRMKLENLHKRVAKERAERLIKKVAENKMSVTEAIYQACNYSDYCNEVDELQANFAFTKAFLAEESGTRGGLPGNNIYIDMSIFNADSLKCLDIDTPFKWKACPGLESSFARINSYSKDTYLKYSTDELASTHTISNRILKCKKQNDVVKRLKS